MSRPDRLPTVSTEQASVVTDATDPTLFGRMDIGRASSALRRLLAERRVEGIDERFWGRGHRGLLPCVHRRPPLERSRGIRPLWVKKQTLTAAARRIHAASVAASCFGTMLAAAG